MRRQRLLGLFVLLVAMAPACSGSVNFSFGGQTPGEAAVELIEGDEMAQRLGVEPITDAVCAEPPDTEVGTIYTCTGQSSDMTINFEVLIEEEDRIFAGPTNVVDSFGLTRLETVAVQQLNSGNGLNLPEDALECGDGSVILDANQQVVCVLTDSGGLTYDALVTVSDTNTGDFTIEITGEAN